jgi:hypothetical protein
MKSMHAASTIAGVLAIADNSFMPEFTEETCQHPN